MGRVEGPGHALQAREQRGKVAERLVQVDAAAGERDAELGEVALDREPGRLVESAENLVDVDRLGCAAESGRVEPGA